MKKVDRDYEVEVWFNVKAKNEEEAKRKVMTTLKTYGLLADIDFVIYDRAVYEKEAIF